MTYSFLKSEFPFVSSALILCNLNCNALFFGSQTLKFLSVFDSGDLGELDVSDRLVIMLPNGDADSSFYAYFFFIFHQQPSFYSYLSFQSKS